MCLCVRMLAFEWKERALKERVNSKCFCWFSAAIFWVLRFRDLGASCFGLCFRVLRFRNYPYFAPIWRLHTNLYKGAWNVSANNSETVSQEDLRLVQIVYILVYFIFLASSTGRFPIYFFVAWQWKRSIDVHMMVLLIAGGIHIRCGRLC